MFIFRFATEILSLIWNILSNVICSSFLLQFKSVLSLWYKHNKIEGLHNRQMYFMLINCPLKFSSNQICIYRGTTTICWTNFGNLYYILNPNHTFWFLRAEFKMGCCNLSNFIPNASFILYETLCFYRKCTLDTRKTTSKG